MPFLEGASTASVADRFESWGTVVLMAVVEPYMVHDGGVFGRWGGEGGVGVSARGDLSFEGTSAQKRAEPGLILWEIR